MKRIHFFIPILLQLIVHIFTLVLFKIFCRIQFEGLENLKGLKKRVIFAVNHSSEWDGPLLRVALPFFWPLSPMYYVSMSKEFYTDSGWRKILYGGTLFNLLGAYPIYSGKKDYNFSLQNFLTILSRDRSVCIFPEGVRTKTGELGVARGGVAFLSHHTKSIVVPVAITGLVHFSTTKLFLWRRRVVVRFGNPIEPRALIPQTNPSIEDYKSGAVYVMKKIADLIQLDN